MHYDEHHFMLLRFVKYFGYYNDEKFHAFDKMFNTLFSDAVEKIQEYCGIFLYSTEGSECVSALFYLLKGLPLKSTYGGYLLTTCKESNVTADESREHLNTIENFLKQPLDCSKVDTAVLQKIKSLSADRIAIEKLLKDMAVSSKTTRNIVYTESCAEGDFHPLLETFKRRKEALIPFVPFSINLHSRK
jgi:hypothetical protein